MEARPGDGMMVHVTIWAAPIGGAVGYLTDVTQCRRQACGFFWPDRAQASKVDA